MRLWYDDVIQQRLAVELDRKDTVSLVSLIFRTSRKRRRGIDNYRDRMKQAIAQRIVSARTRRNFGSTFTW